MVFFNTYFSGHGRLSVEVSDTSQFGAGVSSVEYMDLDNTLRTVLCPRGAQVLAGASDPLAEGRCCYLSAHHISIISLIVQLVRHGLKKTNRGWTHVRYALKTEKT